MSWLRLRTMSLWESGESSGDVSLAELFVNPDKIDGSSLLDMESLAFVICRGGWPKATLKERRKSALIQAEEYYGAVIRSDISRVDNTQRNSELASRLMRSLARNQGTQATISTFLADIAANETTTVS